MYLKQHPWKQHAQANINNGVGLTMDHYQDEAVAGRNGVPQIGQLLPTFVAAVLHKEDFDFGPADAPVIVPVKFSYELIHQRLSETDGAAWAGPRGLMWHTFVTFIHRNNHCG